jgi:hypothetical protein
VSKSTKVLILTISASYIFPADNQPFTAIFHGFNDMFKKQTNSPIYLIISELERK